MRPLFHLLSPPGDRPLWQRIMVMLLCVCGALVLRYFLHPWLGAKSPFAMLLPAVMVCAWISGCGAGLAATALGSAAGAWLFVEKKSGSFFDAPDQVIMIALILLQGVMISLLCGVLHHIFAAWRAAREQAALDFENMADHAPGFVWSTNTDGKPGFVNRCWLVFTGMDPERSAMDRLERIHPSDLERVRAAMAESQRTQKPYHVEYRLRRADGVYRWILEHAVPRIGRDGKCEGFLGSGTDITPSHQEREELLFIDELHRALATSLDLDKTAEAVTRAIVPAVADWCCIQMLDETDGRLKPVRIHHSDPEKVRQAHQGDQAARASLPGAEPSGGAMRILREGEPRLVSAVDDAFLRDMAADETQLAYLRSLGIVSFLGVPLRVRGRIIGVLTLATADSLRTLGHDTLQMAVKLGGIAAFALENARLYQSVRNALAAQEQARIDREHSERRFRSAWEADIFGICMITRDGRVLEGNDAFLRLCGHSREDLENGRIDLRSQIGEREVRFSTFIWEYMPVGGRCEPFEKTCRRNDGQCVPVLVGGSIQPDGESCIVFMLDLTARKTAESALENQRQLLKTIIDAVPAMVAYIDPQERFVLHNRQYERWMGVSHSDIHGRTVRELLGEERYPEAEPHLHAALAGNNVRYEKIIKSPHRSRDAMVTYRPDIDRNGKVAGVVIHAFDITETREMAYAVSRSEKRYRTLITASAAIVWSADARGRLLESNGWEEFTGRKITGDANGMWMDLTHPEDRERVQEQWQRTCREARAWDCVYRLLACDGRYHHVHSRGAAICRPDGTIEEWIGTVTDINLQVEAEQSLRRKEAELKLVVDTMPALVAYVDKNQRYGLTNRAYQKWFGLDPELMRGKLVSEVVGDAGYLSVSTPIRRALAGEAVNFEEYVPYRQGEPRWISSTLTPHFGEDGKVSGFFALAIDISERKRTEMALAELLERYRFLADAMPQNVWTANAAGEQDYVNRRWQDYTGLSGEENEASGWTEITHPEDLELTRQRWTQAVRSGERFEHEHRLRDADGNYHWFLSLALARRNHQGRVVQWVGTSTNIDAQRQAYGELAEARGALRRHADNLENEVRLRTARLEEVNSELEAFTYSASHDLRVPLHHIQGFSDALLDDQQTKMSPESYANLKLIASAAQRMDALIIDLLAYSRLSRAEIVIEPTSLEAIVSDVLVNHAETIKAKKAVVRVESPLPSVPADRVGLHQVISNLIANALKFTAANRVPEIVIRTETIGGRPRLWIEDNGIGIDRRHHESIFKIFHRLHGASAYPGTGIGLSLVKKGMARIGGECGVESEPGKGSRFWLEFQAEPPAVVHWGEFLRSAP